MTASSKQSSEHPTFDGISVVPATARPPSGLSPESNWLVRRGREAPSCRVTSVDVRNTLGTRKHSSRTKAVLFLRKEVIQPHLPVRLPCYDFTPIANPTFDSSLPKGLGHWLRVLPTFVV